MGVIFLLLAGLWSPALANPYDSSLLAPPVAEGDPFSWTIEPLVLNPGTEGRLELHLVVPSGTHVYRDQVDVEVVDAGGLSAGRADMPVGELAADPANKGHTREQYATTAVIYVPLKAPKRFDAPSALVRVQLRYQGCREGLCFPAVSTLETVIVPVRVQESP